MVTVSVKSFIVYVPGLVLCQELLRVVLGAEVALLALLQVLAEGELVGGELIKLISAYFVQRRRGSVTRLFCHQTPKTCEKLPKTCEKLPKTCEKLPKTCEKSPKNYCGVKRA